MKNRFGKLIEKDGFYIILFICVCVVAVTAVLTSKKNLDKINEDKLSKVEDFVIVDEEKEEPSLEIARMEEELIVEEEETEEIEEVELEEAEEAELNEEVEEEVTVEPVPEEIETTANSNNVETMIAPVDGKVGGKFTTDNLVYSSTLDEWTSHKGIDIFAKEGTEVKAALSGKITEVYEDDLWGIVILIDHGEGLMTKYANLSTSEMIEEGVRVNKGDVISKVGKSAPIEMMMESHIHFEVIKDGICVDPKNYIAGLDY